MTLILQSVQFKYASHTEDLVFLFISAHSTMTMDRINTHINFYFYYLLSFHAHMLRYTFRDFSLPLQLKRREKRNEG